MVEVLKRGRWVRAESIPQSLGSVWRTEQYIHGPRIKQPSQFKKLYVFSVDRAKARHIPLTKKPSKATKVKVGPLRSSGRLAVQSYLTPVRAHLRAGHFVRKHDRIMYVKGGKEFKEITNKIANDPEIFDVPQNVNIREVEHIAREPSLDWHDAWGRTHPHVMRSNGIKIFDAADVVIEKSSPFKGFHILHEMGHIEDKRQRGADARDEIFANQFAIRKSKQLGFPIPPSDFDELRSSGKIAKWERKIASRLLKDKEMNI